jgi:hypothetical protein
MSNILYLTSRNYVSPERLVKHIEDFVGIAVEILEYSSHINIRDDYTIQFKEPIPAEKYELIQKGNSYIMIDYYASRIYTDTSAFGSPSMIVSQHHYNFTTKKRYSKSSNGSKPYICKYENYRWVSTTDTPFVYL